MAHVNNFHMDDILDVIGSSHVRIDISEIFEALKSQPIQPDNKIRPKSELFDLVFELGESNETT